MGVGDGAGVGEGNGVGVGEGNADPPVVVNRGVDPVPRTQASGGVQGLLALVLLPLRSQELLAAFTIARRRSFNPLCKEAVP